MSFNNRLQGMKVSRIMVRDQTLERLRSAIIAGHLLPGQRLVEKDLCELIGVSRTSVREALRKLEGEKLVHAESHKGPRVTVPSLEEARQIYEVRSVLERLAAGRAATRATEDQVKRLFGAVEEFGRAVRVNDLMSLVRLANDFYEILLEASQHEVVADLLKSLNARISFLRSTSMSAPGRAALGLREMREIAKAIARRDSEAAGLACARHVDMAAKTALQRLQEQSAKPALQKGVEKSRSLSQSVKGHSR